MLGSLSLFLMRCYRNNVQTLSTRFCRRNSNYSFCSSICSSTMSRRKCETQSTIQRCAISCQEQIRSFSVSRNVSTTSTSEFLCERLSHRCLVKMTGRDVFAFLQGLITNDVRRLEGASSSDAIYSMILNVQGRVLYDVLLYKVESNEPTVLLECDSSITSQLISSLEKYKLRKKLHLSDVGDELQVSAVFSRTPPDSPSSELPPLKFSDKKLVSVVTLDPRLKTFAYRLVAPANVPVAEIVENCERVTGIYHLNRYKVGLSEGTRDLPPGHCLPLESNLVFLNGVAFDKGCYVGQELTARTHHTGVIRKRLMPLILTSEIEVKTDAPVENSQGKVCGKVRNVMGKYGLALLRLEEVVGKQQQLLIKDGDKVVAEASTFIPSWWDTESDAVLKQIAAKRQTASEGDLKQ